MQYIVNRQEKHKTEIKVDILKDAFEKVYRDVFLQNNNKRFRYLI